MRGIWVVGLAAVLAVPSSAVAQRKPPAVVAPPSMERQTQEAYGAWLVESVGQGVYRASVGNSGQSVFGAHCERTGCLPFLATGSACVEGETYAVLVNSPSASFTARPACRHIGALAVLVLPESDAMLDAMSIGGVIGFGTPMASGDIRVSRFSLTGSARAYARALQLARAVPPASRVEERF